MKLDHTHIKSIGLTAKITPELGSNLQILRSILAGYGVEILLENSVARELNLQGYELEWLARECELLISMGGDGTLISTCRQSAEISPFVLGIHTGRLGFLTSITMCECERFFAEFFEGKFEIEQPFMLDVNLAQKNGKILRKIAFNDAVIMNDNIARITQVEAFLNERYFNTYLGDGVIVSTPVGSTAYNMSAGGPILYPLSEVFAVTPVCSHSLTQRPVVLPRGFEVKFRATSEAVLVIDGQDRFDMSELESVSVGLGERFARLIRPAWHDYFQNLKEKLHWGYND